MKKIILIAIVGLFVMANVAEAQRGWANSPADNTGRNLVFYSKAITIGSVDSIAPNASESFYTIPVAAAKTLTIKNTNAKLWDKVHIQFTADATSRLMTLTGSKMLSDINRDTISVMSSRISFVEWYYNGTKWVQYNRYQQH